MATAAIYTRLSQDRDGSKSGTDRQEKDCRALAKRERLKVVEVFSDDDRSAYGSKPRPAFERMLAQLDRFDVVIYWKTDRLVRRATQFWRVVEACEKANTRLVSVVDPIDTSTPLGKGVAGMVAAMGEQESHNTSLRVSRMHEENAKKGRPHGHRRAFGYTDDGMHTVPMEAKAIREARDRILRGESLNAICFDFNERGISPTTAPRWRVTTLKMMISGPRIAGLRQYRGQVVGKAAWRGIVSVEDHERIRAALNDRSRRRRGRPAGRLLTSFLRCGRCNAPLRSTVKGGPGTRTWSCVRVAGDESHCGRLSIRADRVDALIEEALLRRLDSPALIRALKRKQNPRRSNDVAALEERLVQLGKDHDTGLIDRREWLERRGPLQQRIDAARAEIAAERGDGALEQLVGANVPRRWAALTLDQRRAVVRVVIDRITIQPAKSRGSVFDPTRIDIVWRV